MKESRCGFALLEILIAVVIMVGLVYMLYRMQTPNEEVVTQNGQEHSPRELVIEQLRDCAVISMLDSTIMKQQIVLLNDGQQINLAGKDALNQDQVTELTKDCPNEVVVSNDQ